MIDRKLLQRQLEWEQDAVDLGFQKFQESLKKATSGGSSLGMSELPPGQKIIATYVEPMRQAIEDNIIAAMSGKAGGGNAGAIVLNQMDSRVLAYIVIKHTLDAAFKHADLSEARNAIAHTFRDEYLLNLIKDKNPRTHATLLERMARSKSKQGKDMMLAHKKRWLGEDKTAVDPKLHQQAAFWCIETLLDLKPPLPSGAPSTPLIIREHYRTANDKTAQRLVPSPALLQKTKQMNQLVAEMHPQMRPCLMPPKQWTTHNDGGYWGAMTGHVNLIRMARGHLLPEMAAKMPQACYDAVNTLQGTPFRINPKMLGFVVEVCTTNSNTDNYGLPRWSTEDLPRWENAYEEGDTEEYLAYRTEYHQTERRNNSEAGKKLAAIRTIELAKQLAKEDRFYYVWNFDFRGRLYPVSDFLHPQGNDLTKSLLLFAEGKPLGNLEAVRWLARTGAGLYGVDKVSFEEREAWVLEHEKEILESSRNPFEFTWWTKADGGGHALQFLAWCFEWSGYREQGYDYVCGFPCALDGSCNGLQHYAGLLKCEETGEQVNLVADIYQTVAGRI